MQSSALTTRTRTDNNARQMHTIFTGIQVSISKYKLPKTADSTTVTSCIQQSYTIRQRFLAVRKQTRLIIATNTPSTTSTPSNYRPLPPPNCHLLTTNYQCDLSCGYFFQFQLSYQSKFSVSQFFCFR